jgi:predicted nucleic acid-binding protein
MHAAQALAALAEAERVTAAQYSRAFANDILISASCREVGATLVTRNHRDFERIQKVLAFRLVSPWPASRRQRLR